MAIYEDVHADSKDLVDFMDCSCGHKVYAYLREREGKRFVILIEQDKFDKFANQTAFTLSDLIGIQRLLEKVSRKAYGTTTD